VTVHVGRDIGGTFIAAMEQPELEAHAGSPGAINSAGVELMARKTQRIANSQWRREGTSCKVASVSSSVGTARSPFPAARNASKRSRNVRSSAGTFLQILSSTNSVSSSAENENPLLRAKAATGSATISMAPSSASRLSSVATATMKSEIFFRTISRRNA